MGWEWLGNCPFRSDSWPIVADDEEDDEEGDKDDER